MLTRFFTKYENILERCINLFESALDYYERLYVFLTKVPFKLFMLIMDTYEFYGTKFYDFARWTTVPFNWIVVRTWLWYIFRSDHNEPIYEPGVHYVRSKPGGGKSWLSFNLANETLEKTGYASYFTHPVEKPRLSDDGKFWIVDHRVVSLKEFFKDGKQIKRFNTEQFKQFHVDEFHIENNPRMNREKEYNNIFIPFLNQLLSIRHDGFDYNIYIYSQVPNNDIQIMSMITKYHDIKVVKSLEYKQWIKDGKFIILPVKFKFSTYEIQITANGGINRKLYRSWTKKANIKILDRFDTHAMRGNKKHLPLDFDKKRRVN